VGGGLPASGGLSLKSKAIEQGGTDLRVCHKLPAGRRGRQVDANHSRPVVEAVDDARQPLTPAGEEDHAGLSQVTPGDLRGRASIRVGHREARDVGKLKRASDQVVRQVDARRGHFEP
jgi:hypothetical protein